MKLSEWINFVFGKTFSQEGIFTEFFLGVYLGAVGVIVLNIDWRFLFIAPIMWVSLFFFQWTFIYFWRRRKGAKKNG